jgi:hypothetical protein
MWNGDGEGPTAAREFSNKRDSSASCTAAFALLSSVSAGIADNLSGPAALVLTRIKPRLRHDSDGQKAGDRGLRLRPMRLERAGVDLDQFPVEALGLSNLGFAREVLL